MADISSQLQLDRKSTGSEIGQEKPLNPMIQIKETGLSSSTTNLADDSGMSLSHVRTFSRSSLTLTLTADVDNSSSSRDPVILDSFSALPSDLNAKLSGGQVKFPSSTKFDNSNLNVSQSTFTLYDGVNYNCGGTTTSLDYTPKSSGEIESPNFIPMTAEKKIANTLTPKSLTQSPDCAYNKEYSINLPKDTVSFSADDSKNGASFRQGISRYAPYGTRFSAKMKDGTMKTSHIAGDLAARMRGKNGKNSKYDLVLVTHDGELEQLESAVSFYESSCNRNGSKPGPSEVLNYLKECNMDWDYRKGVNVKLLQRNASNFFKRMIEHNRRGPHPHSELQFVEPEMQKAAAILESMINGKWNRSATSTSLGTSSDLDQMDIDQDNQNSSQISSSSFAVKSISTVVNYNLEASQSIREEKLQYSESYHSEHELNKKVSNFYDEAAKSMNWHEALGDSPKTEFTTSRRSKVRSYECMDSDDEFDDSNRSTPFKRQKSLPSNVTPKRHTPKTFSSSGSVISNAPQPIRKGREGLSSGSFLKGLSRHSPYGTRFCATMPNGDKRESYLAGDLAERLRTGPGGRELVLVLHPGEIEQLQSALEYVSTHPDPSQVGAGAMLEYLRSIGKDRNHRKPGSFLLQKNAGNFFKRVQEYERRKQRDPNYLSSPAGIAETGSTA